MFLSWTRFLGLLLVVLIGGLAFANPVAVDVPGAFREAVAGVLSGDPTWPDTVFVQIVGGKNTRFMKEKGLALLEEDFDRFAALIVRAQSPPYVIDYKVQEWYRSRADEQQHELMLGGLRAWLADPLQDAPFTRWGVTTRTRTDRDRALARVEAAELLVDYGDRESLPLIRSLRDSLGESFGGVDAMPNSWVEVWWYLHQAARRIDHPDEAVLCVASGHDRLRLTASSGDVTVARYVNFFVGHHPDMPVDHETARQVAAVVELATVMGRCRERRRAPCTPGNAGLMIQFRDGRELTLSYDGEGVLLCSDNTRYYRWAYRLRQAELLELLKDMNEAFEQEKPRYPPQG